MYFLEKVDEKIEPLVHNINRHIESLDVRSTASFYDADMGGIPTQALLNRICRKVHGSKPLSHYITYAHTKEAVGFSREKNPSFVCFTEYEPHEELEDICKNAKSVAIFGHHKGRDDLKELTRRDNRFSYFNPRDYLEGDDLVLSERGIPILYPFIKVAQLHKLETTFLDVLGTRGYGYKKLYDLMFQDKKPFAERDVDQAIDNIVLATSFRLKNCDKVVKALEEADSPKHEAMKAVRKICFENKLAGRKNRTIVDAIKESAVFGDAVQVFPVKTDFDIIKPFVSRLDEEREYGGYGATVCVQRSNNGSRKVSIRTGRSVNIPELLKLSHDGITYKNFGGHERAGGFISSQKDMKTILRNFLILYFSKTRQNQRIGLEKLSSLDL